MEHQFIVGEEGAKLQIPEHLPAQIGKLVSNGFHITILNSIKKLFYPDQKKVAEEFGSSKLAQKFTNKLSTLHKVLICVGFIVIGGVVYCYYRSFGPKQFKYNLDKVPELSQTGQDNMSDVISIDTQAQRLNYEAYSCDISNILMRQPCTVKCCTMKKYQESIIIQIIDKYGKCPNCRRNLSKQGIIKMSYLKTPIRIFRKQMAKRQLKKRLLEFGDNHFNVNANQINEQN